MKSGKFLFLLWAALSVFAMAADEPLAGTIEERRSLFDPIVVKYWGNFSGPQISNFGRYTTAPTAKTNTTPWNFDDLLTVGYQVTKDFRPGIGMPFNLLVTINPQIQIKPLYFGVIDATLLKIGNLSMHGDFRIYTPIGEMARLWDVKTGFRASQITLLPVGDTDLLLGAYTYIRMWIYGPNGSGYRNDYEVYFSPFANYRVGSSLLLTLWTDVFQLGHQFGTPGGLKNLPMDIQPGVKWEITSKLNINPYINFIPSNLNWNAINLGMVVNAQLL